MPRARSRISTARTSADARCGSMRPRSAAAAAVAVVATAAAAARRSAGKENVALRAGRQCLAALAAGLFHTGASFMGKGDPRTRRGKIYQGSFGKSRVKDPAKRKKKAAKAAKR